MDPFKGDAPVELKRWLDRLIRELPKTGTFTLTANTTTTTVTDPRVNSSSIIVITPTTSTAAAEEAYVTAGVGQFVVTHSNTADNDKTFNYRF